MVTLENLATNIAEILGPLCLTSKISHNELTIEVEASSIVRTLTILRDNPMCKFKVLLDICGVDYLGEIPRFKIVYHLLSLNHNQRIRVKFGIDIDLAAPSVTSVFNSANWYEREIWDLYGIPFSEHPDLRRIMTDYNFEGHPLRKDFPLTGYIEVRYNEEERRVVYEPLHLAQDYRSFDFLSPWEGIDLQQEESEKPLPGDEKAKPQ